MKIKLTLTTLLNETPYLLLDGALATELEARGYQINDALWSAKLLYEQPEAIREVHLDYFRAGARCAITASYQATPQGFATRGFSETESLALIKRSVTLALEARQQWQTENPQAPAVLVAGSVGPYGAWLADGSEYRGDYQLSPEEFKAFHRPRIQALVEAGIDILACETLPSGAEIAALVELLSEYPNIQAWISVTLRDTQHLSDGTPLIEIAKLIEISPQIVALGINCIPLVDTTAALKHLQRISQLPLVVYPNSGEDYDPMTKQWRTHCSHGNKLEDYLDSWLKSGARLVGGCCRTGPEDIARLAQQLAKQ